MRLRLSELLKKITATGPARALCACVLLALSLANVAAGTFNVTTNADSGPGSLRQAIMDANLQPGPDTIIFSNVTGTIFLAATLPVISESLGIIGPGRGLLTVSGGGTCRVFDFGSGTNSIAGLTVLNGLAPVNENGAGIRNQSQLSISDCSIVGCQTRGGFGGGIYNQGDLQLISSILTGNNASGDHGASGTQSGSSGGGSGGFGGGVFTTSGTFRATNCFLVGNTAVGGDGGPANSSTIFSGTGGKGGGLNGGLGGGIYVLGGSGGFGGGGGGGGPDGGKGGNGGFGGGGGGGNYLFAAGSWFGAPGGTGGGSGGASNGGGGGGGGGAGIGGGFLLDSGLAVIVDLIFSNNLATGGSGGAGIPGYGFGGINGSGFGNDVYTRTGTLIATNHPRLMLASQGVGTITKVPDQPFYQMGNQVELTAAPGRWHVFSGWTDGNANNPRVVTIGESNIYTAVFTPTTPLETVTIGSVSRLAPIGMPSAVVDGAFIVTESVSARGSAVVTLTTTFASGTLFYTLDGSDPAISGTLYGGPFTIRKASVLRTIAYNASFSQAVVGDPLAIVILPTLTGMTEGGGAVAIEPPLGDYFSNSLAVVTATPASGWTFLHWLGDASGTNPTVNVTMTRNKTLRAIFGTALNTTLVGGGSLVVSPVSPLYPHGTLVVLTAVPATGNYLAFWANAASGQTVNPLFFSVTNASPTVTAVFASLGGTQTNALTVIPDGEGQVTLTPPGNRFWVNTNVELQAKPEAGQEFLGWAGNASGGENPLVVAMNSNKVITATFTRRPRLQGEGNPEMLSQDGFRLTLTGEFGAAYELFGSTDLNGWSPLGTVTNTWGVVQFNDPEATTNTHRAYRARALEP